MFRERIVNLKKYLIYSALINLSVLDFTFGNTLLFKSNFGPGVSVGAPKVASPTCIFQDISGIDEETGYTWPYKGFDTYFTGIQSISYDPFTLTDFNKYFQHEIKSVMGPLGTPINELYQSVITKPVGIGSAQAPLLFARRHDRGDVTDLYISYWFKFSANLADQLDPYVSSGNWHSLFEFKTGGYAGSSYGDYRIQTTILKDKTGLLYWINKADSNANAEDLGVPLETFWVERNTTTPVPVGKWFKVEVYWHRSSGADGRYWIAIDGKVLFDHKGPLMGRFNNPINRIFIDTTYSGGHPTIESNITGLEIWSGFPCGTGVPCYKATTAPKVNVPILDQAWTESVPNNFTLPINTFIDPNGDVLTYRAQLASGGVLPSWLTFNPITRAFSGTPPKMVGSYVIRVFAKDPKGLETYDDFTLKVNNAPKLREFLPDLVWDEGVASSYIVSSTAFSDEDGDTLTYSAKLSPDVALPTWLSFSATDRKLSGTPPRGIASFKIRVTAKDPHGLSVYDEMIIKINNKPHIASPLYDIVWNEPWAQNFTLPNFLRDIDGDVLTYTVTLTTGEALPSWLTFTSGTNVFSGTPTRGMAPINIRVKVTDPRGLSVSDDFTIKINNRPHLNTTLPDLVWKENVATSYTVPSTAFGDIDGDTLTYKAVLATGGGLPSWLTFNAVTRVLSGKPPVGTGTTYVRIQVQDYNWSFRFDDLMMTTP